MLIILLAVAAGLVAGYFAPILIAPSVTPYIAVAILAAMDTVIGGFVAELEKRFNIGIFVSGFFVNTLLAMLIIVIGKKLGIDLTVAAAVIFGTRIFNNFSTIRHHILQNRKKRGKIKILDENGQVFPQHAGDASEKSPKGNS
jgi:small basic protein